MKGVYWKWLVMGEYNRKLIMDCLLFYGNCIVYIIESSFFQVSSLLGSLMNVKRVPILAG